MQSEFSLENLRRHEDPTKNFVGDGDPGLPQKLDDGNRPEGTFAMKEGSG